MWQPNKTPGPAKQLLMQAHMWGPCQTPASSLIMASGWLSWWRHDMEMLSDLLALCEGNPPVASGSLHKGPMIMTPWHENIFHITIPLCPLIIGRFPSQSISICGALMSSLLLVWTNCQINSWVTGTWDDMMIMSLHYYVQLLWMPCDTPQMLQRDHCLVMNQEPLSSR